MVHANNAEDEMLRDYLRGQREAVLAIVETTSRLLLKSGGGHSIDQPAA